MKNSKRKIRSLGRKGRGVASRMFPNAVPVPVIGDGEEYIVVVVRADGLPSQGRHGSWASFTGPDATEVIARAHAKMIEWQASGNGPYALRLGVISHRVEFPVLFAVERM